MITHPIRAEVILQLILFPLTVLAQEPKIIINELAWMGTPVSASDEWIELFNPGPQEVSLDGWRLEAQDGSPKIKLSGKIGPYSFYLLERTDDKTLPEIKADLIYKGALSNQGENLVLLDDNGVLIDRVEALAGWPAGDNVTKQTMERKADGLWQSSSLTGGTPRAKNSPGTLPNNKKNLKGISSLEKEKLTASLLTQDSIPSKIKEMQKPSALPRFVFVFGTAFVISLLFTFLIFKQWHKKFEL